MNDNQESNFFDMPDDEFISQSDALEAQALAAVEETQTEEGEVDENVLSDTGSEEDSDSGSEGHDEEEETGSEHSGDETDEDDGESNDDSDESGSDAGDEDESDNDESDENSEEEEVTNKDLEALFEPFKANGKMIKVESVEEARTLMQKGANYNKKMAALKPAFKVAKMLENNELLDEDTVSYLIDLQNGNPDALKKLIKDKGIDLDSLESDEDPKYAPTTKHKVTDAELALDDVLAQVRETDTYEATMNLVGKEWDESSKGKLVQNPSMILKLNEHMGNGVYQQIADEMARQDALGQLTGLSDLDAYFKVGNDLMAAGKFGSQTQENSQTQEPEKIVEPVKKKANEQRKSQRKAAAATKAKKPVKEPEVNPFDLSDEDFEKQFGNSIY